MLEIKNNPGFTLIELLVVIALVALMSTLVIFSGDDGRTRHVLQGAYEVIEVSMTQASVLSRSKQQDNSEQQNVHVVISATDPHVLGIYFDSDSGSAGEFDNSDLIEEEYVIKKEVEILRCVASYENCADITMNIVFTWGGSVSDFKIFQEGIDLAGEFGFYQLRFKDQVINFSINKLGIIQMES